MLDAHRVSKSIAFPHDDSPLIQLSIATDADRDEIYGIRHNVYASELGQHHENPDGRLRDVLDEFNVYVVARVAGTLAGFISITPPDRNTFSIDKYVSRDQLPFAFDANLFEVRLLTVTRRYRHRHVAGLLMYAAFRWVDSAGGKRIVAIGRREILPLYRNAGMTPLGIPIQSGRVQYDAMTSTMAELRSSLTRLPGLVRAVESRCNWELPVPIRGAAPCFHGGSFFDAIGTSFESLDRRNQIVNADVLDAWFPPSPRVIAALTEHLPWIVRTSPPIDADGLTRTIAAVRDVPQSCVLPGAGSSDLIYLALCEWLSPASRALILDPTYGEYAHVLEQVIGCRVRRLLLQREKNYDVQLDVLRDALDGRHDFVAIVNPNSPTGRHIPRGDLESALLSAHPRVTVWIDETYVEYTGEDQSLERFAANSRNVVVCKSMSKVYALSGLRAAYLCGPEYLIRQLRGLSPPWSVSLPAQIAAVAALQDPAYYVARYDETHTCREQMASQLAANPGVQVVPGVANFLLCHLDEALPTAARVVAACQTHGVYLRDAAEMGTKTGSRALRIAIKDAVSNRIILDVLRESLRNPSLQGQRR